jgi:hypothetical protein
MTGGFVKNKELDIGALTNSATECPNIPITKYQTMKRTQL